MTQRVALDQLFGDRDGDNDIAGHRVVLEPGDAIDHRRDRTLHVRHAAPVQSRRRAAPARTDRWPRYSRRRHRPYRHARRRQHSRPRLYRECYRSGCRADQLIRRENQVRSSRSARPRSPPAHQPSRRCGRPPVAASVRRLRRARSSCPPCFSLDIDSTDDDTGIVPLAGKQTSRDPALEGSNRGLAEGKGGVGIASATAAFCRCYLLIRSIAAAGSHAVDYLTWCWPP